MSMCKIGVARSEIGAHFARQSSPPPTCECLARNRANPAIFLAHLKFNSSQRDRCPATIPAPSSTLIHNPSALGGWLPTRHSHSTSPHNRLCPRHLHLAHLSRPL